MLILNGAAALTWIAVLVWTDRTYAKTAGYEPLPAKRQLLAPMRARVKAHNDRLRAQMGSVFVAYFPIAYGLYLVRCGSVVPLIVAIAGNEIWERWKKMVPVNLVQPAL